MATKNKSQKRHAKMRFNTRFGISLTQELHNFVIKKIQKGEAVRVEKQSNRVSAWDVPTPNMFSETPEIQNIRVVYDSNTKNIVTILYKDGAVI